MKKCDSRTYKASGEEGVTLLLIAATILGVITFVVIFSLDEVTGHKANLIAQNAADTAALAAKDIFFLTSSYTAMQAAAATLPVNGILLNNDARFTISKVHFVLPVITTTMPTPGVSGASDIFDGSAPKNFAYYGLPCPSSVRDSTTDCMVYVDVSDTANNGDLVPANFWAINEHSAHFAIYIEVVSSTLFLKDPTGLTEVRGKGKSVLSIRHRNAAALANSSIPQSSGRPSYIIGVAAQGETFPLANSAFTYSNPATFPTLNPQHAPPPPYTGFTASNPPGGPDLSLNRVYSNTIFADPTMVLEPLHPIDITPYQTASSVTQVQQELASECHAPWIAVRNMGLELIIETFSRIGWLRDTYQFLSIGSLGDDGNKNPPTRIKAAGEDPFPDAALSPASGSYLPFVNKNGSSGNLRCNFKNDPTCNPDDGLYLEQLRSCYHSNSATGFGGLESADPYFQFIDFSAGGNAYNPQRFESDVTNGNGQAPQNQPWGQYGIPIESTQLGLNSVVRFLGVEQNCPVNGYNYNGNGACAKDTTSQALLNPNNNAKPDFVSFLKYVRGNGNAWEKAGPLEFNGSQTNQSSNEDISTPSTTHPSDAILIMNQRLDLTSGEKNEIQSEVNLLNGQGQRVIVVFFARGPDDEGTFTPSAGPNDSVMNELEETFCANNNFEGNCGGTPTNDDNVAIRVAPGNTGTYGCLRAPAVPPFIPTPIYNTDLCFQKFYEDMLTRDPPRSIEQDTRGLLSSVLFDVGFSL